MCIDGDFIRAPGRTRSLQQLRYQSERTASGFRISKVKRKLVRYVTSSQRGTWPSQERGLGPL